MKKRCLTILLSVCMAASSLQGAGCVIARGEQIVAEADETTDEVPAVEAADETTEEIPAVEAADETTEEIPAVETADKVVTLTQGTASTMMPEYTEKVTAGDKVTLSLPEGVLTDGMTVFWSKQYFDPEQTTPQNLGYEQSDAAISEDKRSLTVDGVQKTATYVCNISPVNGAAGQVPITYSKILMIDTGFQGNPMPNPPYTVEAGASQTLTVPAGAVTVNEGVALHYRWRTEAKDEQGNFKEYKLIEGANGSACTVNNITKSGFYFCDIYDDYGNNTSVSFQVSIDSGLAVTDETYEMSNGMDAQEYAVPVALGGEVTLQPTVTIKSGTIKSRTWSVYEHPSSWIVDQTQYITPSADGTTCTVKNVDKKLRVQLTVTDDLGNNRLISYAVSVDSGLELAPAQGKEDASGIVPVKLVPGQDLSLAVSYGKTPQATQDAATIAWKYSTQNPKWFMMPGEDLACSETTYTMANCLQAGYYTCEATDQYGTKKAVYFQVIFDDGYSLEMSDYLYCLKGKPYTLTLKPSFKDGVAEEYKNLSYEWNCAAECTKDGASITFAEVTEDISISCKITNAYGLSKTWYGTISPTESLQIANTESYDWIYDDDDVVYRLYKVFGAPGEEVSLTLKMLAGSAVDFTWTNETTPTEEPIKDEGKKPSEEGIAESTIEVTADAYKRYKCDVKDHDGDGNEMTVYFDVVIENGFEVNYDSSARYELSDTVKEVTLSVSASAKNGTVKYQWTKGYDSKVLSTASTCKVTEAGWYMVTVSDQYGNSEERSFSVYEIIRSDAGKDGKLLVKWTKSDYYQRIRFAIIPSETAEYQFVTPKNSEIYVAAVYDDKMEKVDDYDEWEGSCSLSAGKTYYLDVYADYFDEEDGVLLNKEYEIAITGGKFAVIPLPAKEKPAEVNPGAGQGTGTGAGTGTSETPAAPAEQTPAPAPTDNKKPVSDADGNTVTTTAKGEATITTVKKTTKKSLTIKENTTVNGVTYKVTTIAANAFKNATKATAITLPGSIKEIKANAFKGSKIKTVKMTVKKGQTLKINKKAFKGSKVKTVQVSMKGATAKEKKKVKDSFKKAGIKNVKIK